MATIGSVGVSNREIAPVRAETRNKFTNLAEGLGTFGGALVRKGEEVRLFQEQAQAKANAADDASLAADFIRFKGELDREFTELTRGISGNGSGFFDGAADFFEERGQAFMEKVPEDLKEKYKQKWEVVRQTGLNSAFNTQLLAQDNSYKTNLAELNESAFNNIASGRATLGDVLPDFEEFFANSPLPKLETEVLYKQLTENLQRAQFSYDITQEAMIDDSAKGALNRPIDGSDVVAAGLPAGAPALLNTIAYKEANGYDVLYGGKTFDDYSKHPNQKIEITSGPNKGLVSTAAGRYQFLYSTWIEAKNALGLTDFSPESQDRAAWWLAKRDYKNKAGRNLEIDLATGDPSTLALVRATLGGKGNNTTWEGLQNISDEEFAQRVASSGGTPSALIDDPRYASISLDEKQAMWLDANKKRQDIMAMEQDQELLRVASVVNGMAGELLANKAGLGDLQNLLAEEEGITNEQQKTLITAYEAANVDAVAEAKFLTAATTNTAEMSRDKFEDGFNVYYRNSEGKQAIRDKDADYVNGKLLPLYQRTGFVPRDVVTDLERQATSLQGDKAVFALATASSMLDLDERGFRAAFGDEMESAVEYYRQMNDYLSEADFIERLSKRNDPQQSVMVKEEIKTIRKDKPSAFSGPEIADDLGGDLPDGFARAGLERDYAVLYEYEYGLYRNHKQTDAAVKARLSRTWGESELAGGGLIKNPPEKVYKPFQGSFDYITEQLQSELGEGEYRLIPNLMTENDIQSRSRVPAMQVMEKKDGVWTGVFDEDNNPKMFVPEYTKEMEATVVDRTLKATDLTFVQEELHEYETELHQRAVGGKGNLPDLSTEELLQLYDEAQEANNALLDELMQDEDSLWARWLLKKQKRVNGGNTFMGLTDTTFKELRDANR